MRWALGWSAFPALQRRHPERRGRAAAAPDSSPVAGGRPGLRPTWHRPATATSIPASALPSDPGPSESAGWSGPFGARLGGANALAFGPSFLPITRAWTRCARGAIGVQSSADPFGEVSRPGRMKRRPWDRGLRAQRRRGSRPKPRPECHVLDAAPSTAESTLGRSGSHKVGSPGCGRERECNWRRTQPVPRAAGQSAVCS